MNFLAPLFLAGALAVVLPVIFHLARRAPRQRQPFGSLMFLRPSPPRLTRRNRLEHWILLLLRCVALGLLAFGFARPFVRQALPETPGGTVARQVVVLLDTSASMRRGDLWARASERAQAVAREAGLGDQVALLTFDRTVQPRCAFEEWSAAPREQRVAHWRQVLAGIQPGWGETRLDQALMRAAELLSESDDGSADRRRQIVVLTDLQAGSRLGALPGYDWPGGVEVMVERLTASVASNAGLHWAPEDEDRSSGGEPAVRLRVTNEPESGREQFQVGWVAANGAGVGAALDVYVPAGQSRIVSLPWPARESGADRVVLWGDGESFDNTVFVVPPETQRLDVMVLGDATPGDNRQPLYFLRRAFQETRRQQVRLDLRGPGTPPAVADVGAAPLIVVTTRLTPEWAVRLREGLGEGHTVLFVPPDAAAADTLGLLLGTVLPAVEEAPSTRYGMLGEIDFRHPLFAAFTDVRFNDFTRIHFWKHRRFEVAAIPGARVVARFDDGAPAMFEVGLGRGRLMVWASGWHPADSQLALSSKFVPLLYGMVELSAGTEPVPVQQVVGEAVSMPGTWARAGEGIRVDGPEGLATNLPAGEVRYGGAAQPGIYRFTAAGVSHRVAVNLALAESQTAPLQLDVLEQMGAPGARAVAGEVTARPVPAVLKDAQLEGRQRMWRWVLGAALGVVLVETGLAGWTARRRMTAGT